MTNLQTKLTKFFAKKQQKTSDISEFEEFKIRKIAKKIYQMNYDLTFDIQTAKKMTVKQLKNVYDLDKSRFNFLYTKYIKVGA